MADPDALREQLAQLLDWRSAHATFDQAVDGLPPSLRGTAPAGLPYSPWQLVEHIRLTQLDILEFCRDAVYEEPTWPDDYWPAGAAPPSDEAWNTSLAGYRADRAALQALARDPAVDLHAPISHGDGQTILRELVLVADHTAYHVGELIVVRRLLGAWGG
jgi:hypothetical protein